jgi:hypothetical protein
VTLCRVPGVWAVQAEKSTGPARATRSYNPWTKSTADQEHVRVRFGEPIVDGDRVAVEWWTTLRSEGGPVTLVGVLAEVAAGPRATELDEDQPATLIGTAVLRFAPDGWSRRAAGSGSWSQAPTPHMRAGAAEAWRS